ncbi:MAG: DinB family protein [Acidobacteria bacterium]|nr:DinB family protein [Acidobacteriota bacterium]
MTASDAKMITEFLLGNFEHEMGITEGVFAVVPADKQHYRPDPVTKSAIDLLRHITLEDEWLLQSIANGAFTPPPDDSEKCGIMNAADAIAEYKRRIPAAVSAVRALTGEQMLREMAMGPMKMPAIQVLSMLLRHSAHHRGQLSTYLRSMGAKVPGIYGPSADTRAAQAAGV